MRLPAGRIAALVAATALATFAPAALAQEAPAPTSTAAAAAAEADREARLVAELEAADDPLGSSDSFGSRDSDAPMISKLFSSVLALAAICALAYVLLGKLLPRLLRLSPAARNNMSASAPKGIIEVVDRLPLDQKRTLFLVKVGEELFLVASAGDQLTLLSPVAAGDIDAAPEPVENVLGKFSNLLKERTQKET